MTYQLYNCDCLDFMRTLDAGSVNAVITDPPYGQNYKPGGNSSVNLIGNRYFENRPVIGDNKKFDPTPFIPFNVVVLFGANNYSDKLPSSRGWIIWDKCGDFEPIDFADGEMIWTNQDRPVRIFSHHWRGVIKASEVGKRQLHPTQKPIALMQWIISEFTVKGDTIFDPFMGSGTTGVACMQLGRKFIGCEIDEGYFKIAEKRISEAAAQPPLFSLDASKIEATQAAFV